jgi:hypothetical protein
VFLGVFRGFLVLRHRYRGQKLLKPGKARKNTEQIGSRTGRRDDARPTRRQAIQGDPLQWMTADRERDDYASRYRGYDKAARAEQ